MKVTKKEIMNKILAYLNRSITLEQMVDWAEKIICEAEYDQKDFELIKEILTLGWTPLVGQYFGVLKVLLRRFLVIAIIIYLNWCSVVKCLMNSSLIVEAKIPTNSFFCFPNRLVIIDIHFLVLH